MQRRLHCRISGRHKMTQKDIYFTKQELVDALVATAVAKNPAMQATFDASAVNIHMAPVVKGGKCYDVVMGLHKVALEAEPVTA